ncbi:Rha family transcriptional regulator [Ectopseudomonas khazarica]|uniref:Rha family transcriptional regulator n=1 Tax=Ectopseudomonas khazarica TaxID=2502979 RepID=UPI003B948E6F
MNALITTAVTMNSLEIAEMVGKRNDNVKRTVETLVDQGVISLPQIEEVKIQRERRDEKAKAYRFENEKGKRDSIIVVAQLCPEFTARLVDRWQELEAKLAKPVITDLSHLEILKLAVESGQKLIAADAEREHAIRDAVVTVEKALHGLLGKVSPGKALQTRIRNPESPGAKRTRAYRERKKAAAAINK